MPGKVKVIALLAVAASLLMASLRTAPAAPPPRDSIPATIEFNRDIRPLISENCYFCHGPDKNKRKADLRLDTKGGLFDEIDKIHPVVPGKLEQSELFRRITTDDPDDQMPPAKSNKRLTARQIAIFKKWIEQGAPWEGHWAYQKPKRFAIPPLAPGDIALNPIDAFVLERVHEHGLQSGIDADKVTLCRRLYFDLLGLPPTPQQVHAFIDDTRPDAYEKLVDQLLSNPHFGERMAVFWLDQVRYADTIGYHSAPSTYKIPACGDVPAAFNVSLFKAGRNKEDVVYRSKAVGEPPLMLGISVFQALRDAIAACGDGWVVPRLDAPATAERVLMAIETLRAGIAVPQAQAAD